MSTDKTLEPVAWLGTNADDQRFVTLDRDSMEVWGRRGRRIDALYGSDAIAELEARALKAEGLLEVQARDLDELDIAVRLILPMAKGFAHEHQVGSNLIIVQQVENTIRARTPSEEE